MIIHHIYDHEGKWMVFAAIDSLGFCFEKDSAEGAEIAAYLSAHPDALQPEPLPLPPTAEQLAQQEIASLKAYLASTDWYVARFAETGTAIPDEVKVARAAARLRIDELRGQV